jgi:REP element-mobilizing transposase RayT
MTTYGRTHAVRMPDFDYAADVDVHVTLCAADGAPFENAGVAHMVCDSVEFCSRKLGYRLYGYCLMPDHLHVLLSPGESGRPLKDWLRDFKSYTNNEYRKHAGKVLWQRSAHDHVCRQAETAEAVLAYIIENPVRRGLVERWQDWPWTKVFIAM